MTTLDYRSTYKYKTATNRLGLWLFILSDSFVFLGLLVSRFYLLGNSRPHLDQTLGLIVTAILLISSFSMNRAETATAHTFLSRLGSLVRYTSSSR